MVLVHKLQDDKNSSKASPFLRRKSIKKNKKKDYERSQRNAAVLLIALSFKGKQKILFTTGSCSTTCNRCQFLALPVKKSNNKSSLASKERKRKKRRQGNLCRCLVVLCRHRLVGWRLLMSATRNSGKALSLL